jgi:hypothetical protein
LSDYRVPAECARIVHRARQFIFFCEGTSWSDQRYARARRERLGATKMFC